MTGNRGEEETKRAAFSIPICTCFPHCLPLVFLVQRANLPPMKRAPLLLSSTLLSLEAGFAALFQNSPEGAGASLQRCSRHRPIIQATRYLLRSGATRTVCRPHLAGRNNEARDSFDRNVSRDYG